MYTQCQHCGRHLPELSRAKYCSAVCRQKAYRQRHRTNWTRREQEEINRIYELITGGQQDEFVYARIALLLAGVARKALYSRLVALRELLATAVSTEQSAASQWRRSQATADLEAK